MARSCCTQCGRPERLCYCSSIRQETACIDLLILQHPREVKHPLNSARIADLSLSNCTIKVGEDFSDDEELQELIANKHCCLLFPTPTAETANNYCEQHEKPELCIILDGTWRKARKMYHLNPCLQELPALTLSEANNSEYRIRKSPQESALSTVEATVALLREISHQPDVHQSCLDTFAHMIDLQIEAMGEETYRRNYPS